MKFLLDDPRVTKPLASAEDSINRILFQVMLDITTEENVNTVGPTILALKHAQDMLLLAALRGAIEIKKENKTKA